MVQYLPGRSKGLLPGTQGFEHPRHLVSPQELGYREWVHRAIWTSLSLDRECHPSSHSLCCQDQAPPSRDQGFNGTSVLFSHDHRCTVKDRTINVDLLRKPAQGINVALDFVTGEMAVDNSYISPASTMLESKFVHHNRFGVIVMPAQPLAMELLTYLFIIHSKSPAYSQSLQVSKLPLNRDMTKKELNRMGPNLGCQCENIVSVSNLLNYQAHFLSFRKMHIHRETEPKLPCS